MVDVVAREEKREDDSRRCNSTKNGVEIREESESSHRKRMILIHSTVYVES